MHVVVYAVIGTVLSRSTPIARVEIAVEVGVARRVKMLTILRLSLSHRRAIRLSFRNFHQMTDSKAGDAPKASAVEWKTTAIRGRNADGGELTLEGSAAILQLCPFDGMFVSCSCLLN